MANAVQDVALGRTSERGGEHVDVMPNRSGHAWEKLLDEKTGAATTWKIGAICRNEVASGAA